MQIIFLDIEYIHNNQHLLYMGHLFVKLNSNRDQSSQ